MPQLNRDANIINKEDFQDHIFI